MFWVWVFLYVCLGLVFFCFFFLVRLFGLLLGMRVAVVGMVEYALVMFVILNTHMSRGKRRCKLMKKMVTMKVKETVIMTLAAKA